MDNLQRTAYHEAGHVVIAWRYGALIRDRTLSIDVHNPHVELPHVQLELSPPRLESLQREMAGDIDAAASLAYRVEREIRILLAGGVAEMRAHRLRVEMAVPTGTEDATRAAALAAAYCGPKDSSFLSRINQSVGWVLRRRTRTWSGVETLAAELRRRNVIRCDEISILLAGLGVRQLPPGQL